MEYNETVKWEGEKFTASELRIKMIKKIICDDSNDNADSLLEEIKRILNSKDITYGMYSSKEGKSVRIEYGGGLHEWAEE